MGRPHFSPLTIQRTSYGAMVFAAVCAGWAGYRESALPMIGSFGCALIATWFYVRSADILMDFDYRSARRQALVFCVGGLLAALLGCVVASIMVQGSYRIGIRILGYAVLGGGLAVGLAGLITTLWTFTGTYAAEQIEKRSQEEW